MLEARNLSKSFGGLMALKNVSFHIDQKETVGLIGPNGAGKTTLFNLITGVYRPTSGRIKFRDEDITGLQMHATCRKGITRTFQIVKPFLRMTTLENVLVGVLYGNAKVKGMNDAKQKAEEVLKFTGLSEKKDAIANSLTIVDRKRLELARALATEPQLLLLDEVVAGLNPKETADTVALLRDIRDRGITLFVVEHVMKVIMGISDRIIVLHHGELIAEGAPEEISKDKRVIEAYLGERYKA